MAGLRPPLYTRYSNISEVRGMLVGFKMNPYQIHSWAQNAPLAENDSMLQSAAQTTNKLIPQKECKTTDSYGPKQMAIQILHSFSGPIPFWALVIQDFFFLISHPKFGPERLNQKLKNSMFLLIFLYFPHSR